MKGFTIFPNKPLIEKNPGNHLNICTSPKEMPLNARTFDRNFSHLCAAMIRITLFAFCLLTAVAQAQTDTTYTSPEPVGGIERLALVFYTIEFAPDQRQLLVDRPLEFFFYISDEGEARLESTNGIRNPAIVDSLMSAGQNLPPFTPATRGGVPVQSLYMMELTFPSYQPNSNIFYSTYGQKPSGKYRLDEFDTLSTDHPSIQFLFGGFANGFVGSAGDYLGTGGGFKVEMLFYDANLMYYGMNMAFSGNKRQREYSLSDTRDQAEAPPTLFLGVTIGKKIDDFLIQADADMVLQNIITVDTDTDEEPVQFWGFSPGLIVNYPIGIGSRVAVYPHGSMQFDHYLNLHAGYRQLLMGNSQAKGGMWEVGLSWRFGSSPVNYYRFPEKAE
jgi:hypothetical protein